MLEPDPLPQSDMNASAMATERETQDESVIATPVATEMTTDQADELVEAETLPATPIAAFTDASLPPRPKANSPISLSLAIRATPAAPPPVKLPSDLVDGPTAAIFEAGAKAAGVSLETSVAITLAMASAAMGAAYARLYKHPANDMAAGFTVAIVSDGQHGSAAIDLAIQTAAAVERQEQAEFAAKESETYLHDQILKTQTKKMIAAAAALAALGVEPRAICLPDKPLQTTSPIPFLVTKPDARRLSKMLTKGPRGLLLADDAGMPTLPPLRGPSGNLVDTINTLQTGLSEYSETRNGDRVWVERCAATVIGQIAPATLKVVRASHCSIGRTVWVSSTIARRPINVPASLVDAILWLRKASGKPPHEFKIEQDAVQIFKSKVAQWDRHAQGLLAPSRAAYDRAKDLAIRMAIALHALKLAAVQAQMDPLVSKKTVGQALALTDAFLAGADHVLGPLSVSEEIDHARAVLNWIRRTGRIGSNFSTGDAQRGVSQLASRQVDEALALLVTSELVSTEVHSSGLVNYRASQGAFV
jgi:hypothetical protein